VGISSYQGEEPINPVNGMIWVDADGIEVGGQKPAYVYDGTGWQQIVSGLDTSANYTFTGTVVIPGYEKEIPLQSSAPSSPASSDLWVDNTVALKPVLKVYNGTDWVVAGSVIEPDDDQIVLSQRMFMQ
jgi:hypothetical protein